MRFAGTSRRGDDAILGPGPSDAFLSIVSPLATVLTTAQRVPGQEAAWRKRPSGEEKMDGAGGTGPGETSSPTEFRNYDVRNCYCFK